MHRAQVRDSGGGVLPDHGPARLEDRAAAERGRDGGAVEGARLAGDADVHARDPSGARPLLPAAAQWLERGSPKSDRSWHRPLAIDESPEIMRRVRLVLLPLYPTSFPSGCDLAFRFVSAGRTFWIFALGCIDCRLCRRSAPAGRYRLRALPPAAIRPPSVSTSRSFDVNGSGVALHCA